MPLSKRIAIGAACLVVVGLAGFRMTAWVGGPAAECRFRLGTARADARDV